MFCPKCKALMYPKDKEFVCNRCGFKKKKTGRNIVVTKQEKKETVVLEGKTEDILPTTKIKCSKCGHNEATWMLRQMRGSDEPESRFYTCTKCGYKWRED